MNQSIRKRWTGCLFLLLCSACRCSLVAAGLSSLHHHPEDESSSLSSLLSSRLSRALALGDFDSFNQAVQNVTLKLPDPQPISMDLMLPLTIVLSNLTCRNLQIGDMASDYSNSNSNSNELTLNVDVFPFAMDCFGDYSYDFGYFSSSGTLKANAADSRLQLAFGFHSSSSASSSFNSTATTSSSSLMTALPNATSVDSCQGNIAIQNLELSGGIDSVIANVFEDVVGKLVSTEATTAFCNNAGSFFQFFNDILHTINGGLAGWIDLLSYPVPDALQAERDLVIPAGVQLLNWRDSNGTLASLLRQWFNQSDSNNILLSGTTTAGSNDPSQQESPIHGWLREHVLDENGVLTLDAAHLGNWTRLQSHNRFVEAEIHLNSIRIHGLDTVRVPNPFVFIGNYTVETLLTWESLFIEADLQMNMTTSSQKDSLLQSSTPIQSIETIRLGFNVSDLDVGLSIMVAANVEQLALTPLGSLLQFQTLLPCLMPSLVASNISAFHVVLGDMSDAQLVEGIASPGLHRVMTSIVNGLFTMYKPTLLRVTPYVLNDLVRTTMKQRFLDPIRTGQSECTSITPPKDDFIDFRDLFLEPTEAKNLGGSGAEPYGKSLPLIRKTLWNRMKQVDADGLAGINELLIRPLTRMQSGTDGVLLLATTLFNASVDLASVDLGATLNELSSLRRFRISLSNATIENLDTVQRPVTVLDPTNQSSNVLHNHLYAGLPDRPIAINMTFFVIMEGDSFLNGISENELLIRTSVNSLEVLAELSAWMSSDLFWNLPMGDVNTLDCWLAMLQSPTASSSTGANATALAIERFVASFLGLKFDIQCVRCTGTGTAIIPDLLQTLVTGQASFYNLMTTRLEELSSTMLEHEPMRSFLDGALADARKSCPSHPDFDEHHANRTDLNRAKFPILNDDGMDTFFYTGLLAAWASFLTMAEGQSNITTSSSEPLSAQESFVPPDGVRFLNFEDLGSSTGLGEFANTAFSALNLYLMISPEKEEDKVEIKSAFRDWLGANPTTTVDLNITLLKKEGFTLTVDALRIGGLDSFVRFTGFDPIGPQTLQTDMKIGTLTFDFDIVASYPASTVPDRKVTFSFSLDEMEFSVSWFIAFDVAMFEHLMLGSILDSGNILPCIVSAAYRVEIPNVELSLSNFSGPTVTGLQEETAASLAEFWQTTSQRYSDSILQGIPKIVEGPLRSLIADYIQRRTASPRCPFMAPNDSASTFIDFRELLRSKSQAMLLGASGEAAYGDLIPWFFNLVDTFFLQPNPKTGLIPVNDRVIVPWTENQSGTRGRLSYPKDVVKQKLTFFLLDMIFEFRISDVLIENLDTIGAPFSVLTPVKGEPQTLNNIATMGVSTPLRLSANVFFKISSESSSSIENSFRVSLSAENVSLILNLVVNMITKALFAFPVRDLADRDCVLSTLQPPTLDSRGIRQPGYEVPFSILNLNASFENLRMNVTCIDCGSPRMVELTERLTTPEGIEDGTSVASKFVRLLVERAGPDFITLSLDRKVAQSRARCKHLPEFSSGARPKEFRPFESPKSKQSYRFLIGLVIAAVCLVVLVSAFLTTVRVIVRRRHQKWLETAADERILLVWQQQQREKDLEVAINRTSDSLFSSPDVPRVVRILMPIFIVVNIGLFIAGHLSSAASVNIVLYFAGDVYREANFHEFSIATGTIDLWKAGGYELAILIVLFSGIWPYVKQLISLFLWFLPPSSVSTSKRLDVYLWLDVLAKWSMVDIFTLLVSLVAFRVTVQSPDVAFLPRNFYQIDLLVIPKLGLYANFTAQIVSQISSHFIIHYHRKVVREAKRRLLPAILLGQGESFESQVEGQSDQPDPSKLEAISLASHAFSRSHRDEHDRLVPRFFVSPLVCMGAACIAIFVSLGCALPSFSAEILGLFGLIVESGNNLEAAIKHYSMFNMMKVLFDQAKSTNKAGDYIGLATFGALLFVTVLIAPIVQAGLLVYQWLRPLTIRQLKRLIVVNEIIQAWQYTEVFALSIVFGSWQLRSVSHYMLNIFCEYVTGLQNLFGQLTYFGLLEAKDAQCFLVDSKIENGFLFLVCGAMILALLNTFVSNAAMQYLQEKSNCGPMASMHTLGKQFSAEEIRAMVEPSSALFTDRFRWALIGSGGRSTDGMNRANEVDKFPSVTKNVGDVNEETARIASTRSADNIDEYCDDYDMWLVNEQQSGNEPAFQENLFPNDDFRIEDENWRFK